MAQPINLEQASLAYALCLMCMFGGLATMLERRWHGNKPSKITTCLSCLLLTRQNVPHQQRTDAMLANIPRGGYILVEGNKTPEAIVIATGSEIHLAVEAAYQINQQGYSIRVVSMPCTEILISKKKLTETVYYPHVLFTLSHRSGE